MPKLAANLSMLFTELDFMARFEAASNAGFKGVEYLFPYDFSAEKIKEKLEQYQLTQVLFNLPAGDWAKGERGIACLPDRVEEFRHGVDSAIEYAHALGCKQVNCLSGIVPQDLPQDVAEETLVANLKYAADKLAQQDICLVLEAINTQDMPGFCVSTTMQTLDIIERVGSDNLRSQYDIYHMQIMEGNIARTMTDHLTSIGHVQLADNPGRHEPGTGELNYEFLFKHIDSIGYQGWIGCEYVPANGTEAGLGWLKKYNLV
ncbi:hydroxypyruvate isomerase [Vibrio sp. MACH09]|uniref:hydroxypyruvate isomerase n=1 Tax=unclassified Vibrio TaxID=2614977 RepID=UPI0014935690|nr:MULTISPECIES: hydroxypyruvate isomerase [unclassified Vibrio]NOI68576.1 hydroxypyruvate isomerase [Vibrio sp. 99-8-1]GLO60326.1 hydroxypyruvate isomerase [Vibrio sp. MACH09]